MKWRPNVLPISRHLCLAVCCLECQYFQCFSWSSLHFSSPNTTITTLWPQINIHSDNLACCTDIQHVTPIPKNPQPAASFRLFLIFLSYPDFSDGLLYSFVVSLPEGDGIKLALVKVRHGPVTCLLTQRLGCLKGVFKVAPTTHWDNGRFRE